MSCPQIDWARIFMLHTSAPATPAPQDTKESDHG
jgi:hypothetical protein